MLPCRRPPRPQRYDRCQLSGEIVPDNFADQGAAVARTKILDEFPYFGAPHADPVVDRSTTAC
jgi:hypothetical protein